jgi:ATP-dependent DNA ligase
MEAKPRASLPEGSGWQFEPKWDGIRCLAFKDGPRVALQSKAGQPLHRFFPEIVRSLAAFRCDKFVLDGEIVVPEGKSFSFDALLERVHSEDDAIAVLARALPATYVLFDLLVDTRGRLEVGALLAQRRLALEDFARTHLVPNPVLRLSPATSERWVVDRWKAELPLRRIDGIVAKRIDLPYMAGERTGMHKVKWTHTVDCVVGGFRYAQGASSAIASLLLGLYDDAGFLHHVGFCSRLREDERTALAPKLERLVREPGFSGRVPGGASRWGRPRPFAWRPLAPLLVVEVEVDHLAGGRFRHGTRLVSWRPDKLPQQCTMDQVVHLGQEDEPSSHPRPAHS